MARTVGAKGFQRILRMEMIARLEAQLVYNATQIATMVGLSIGGVNSLKYDPDYQLVKARVLGNVVTVLDEELATDLKGMKSKLRTMVPVALDVLFKNLTGPNPRVAQDAAKTILDRDARLIPVSKTTVVAETDAGHSITSTDNTIASELLNAMGKTNDAGKKETLQ
jgi:hypothetical protein